MQKQLASYNTIPNRSGGLRCFSLSFEQAAGGGHKTGPQELRIARRAFPPNPARRVARAAVVWPHPLFCCCYCDALHRTYMALNPLSTDRPPTFFAVFFWTEPLCCFFVPLLSSLSLSLSHEKHFMIQAVKAGSARSFSVASQVGNGSVSHSSSLLLGGSRLFLPQPESSLPGRRVLF